MADDIDAVTGPSVFVLPMNQIADVGATWTLLVILRADERLRWVNMKRRDSSPSWEALA
jgi:hypothetical protein